jgi:hypothetical protein
MINTLIISSVCFGLGDSMKVITDTVFTIGRTHTICEDYVIGGTGPISHIILCDGCSSSRNTDVGARLLAHSMRRVIEQSYSSSSYAVAYLEKKQLTIGHAYQVVSGLGLNRDCLDATLITAVRLDREIRVYMYGDGVILYCKKDTPDKIRYYKVDFYGNMPYYISYLLSNTNRTEYERIVQEACAGEAITIESDEGTETRRWDSELLFEFDLDEVSLVAISSDGICQFTDIKTGNRLSLNEVAKELLAFKIPAGEFLKRRVKKALEAYGREKIYPTDDVSLGVFLNETN